jgi:hypothetical protein
MPMTNRNLGRRLERLEVRLLTTNEEQILIVRFISQDGQVADTKEFKRAADRSPVKQKRRWWR